MLIKHRREELVGDEDHDGLQYQITSGDSAFHDSDDALDSPGLNIQLQGVHPEAWEAMSKYWDFYEYDCDHLVFDRKDLTELMYKLFTADSAEVDGWSIQSVGVTDHALSFDLCNRSQRAIRRKLNNIHDSNLNQAFSVEKLQEELPCSQYLVTFVIPSTDYNYYHSIQLSIGNITGSNWSYEIHYSSFCGLTIIESSDTCERHLEFGDYYKNQFNENCVSVLVTEYLR